METMDIAVLKSKLESSPPSHKQLKMWVDEITTNICLQIHSCSERIKDAKEAAEEARDKKVRIFGIGSKKKINATSDALVQTNEAIAEMNNIIQASIGYAMLSSAFSELMRDTLKGFLDNGLNIKGEIIRLDGNGEEAVEMIVQNAENFIQHEKKQEAQLSKLNNGITKNAEILGANASKIKKNSDSIEVNAQKIDENRSNIETNASNIDENRGNIKENADRIAKNVKKINANTTNIARNADNIEANASNIEENRDNIRENADHIAKNVKKISANASKITANKKSIDQNATNIEQLINLTRQTSARVDKLEMVSNKKLFIVLTIFAILGFLAGGFSLFLQLINW